MQHSVKCFARDVPPGHWSRGYPARFRPCMIGAAMPDTTLDLGRRIVVYGASGSGKTTTAGRIARVLGLPHIEIDGLYHLPGWQEPEPEDFREKVRARLAECSDGWVVDGNYSRLTDIVLAGADTAIWLRLPFRTTYPRLVKRTLRRAWTGEMLWGTNRETWRQLLSRDSMLIFGIQHYRLQPRKTREKLLLQRPANVRTIVLRSDAAVERLLRRIE